MNDTLHTKFGGTKTNAPGLAADPDVARVLINDLRRKLQVSATARRLIQMGDDRGAVVKVLKGPAETVSVPEGKTIYMTITPRTVATARLALQYAGALREVEQNILGSPRPGVEADDDTWMTQHAVKNVDMIKNLCQIVRDLSEGPIMSEFLDSLVALGHDKIYKALMNGASDEDLLRIYAEQEQIEIKEG